MSHVGLQLTRHLFELGAVQVNPALFTNDNVLRSMCEIIVLLNNSKNNFLTNEDIYTCLTRTLHEMHGDERQQQDVAESFSCVITRLLTRSEIDTKLQIKEDRVCMNHAGLLTAPPCSEPNDYSMSCVPLNVSKSSLQTCLDDFFKTIILKDTNEKV